MMDEYTLDGNQEELAESDAEQMQPDPAPAESLEDAPAENALAEDALAEDALAEEAPKLTLSQRIREIYLPKAAGLSKKIGPKVVEHAKTILPLALLLIAVLTVIYYILFPARNEFHSDCTDTIYWAKASYDSGHMFNEDFHYACLLPFGINLVMQFFMQFFGLSMTTHMLGMLTFFLLFIGGFLLMLHEMHFSFGWSCCAGAVLLTVLCSSEKLREIFWGHTIYYSLGILLLFFGLFLLTKIENLGNKIPVSGKSGGVTARKAHILYWIAIAVLLVFFLFCNTNQISALTIFSLPFMAAIALERLLDRNTPLCSKKNAKTLLLLVGLGIMLVAGIKLGDHWAGDIVAGYQDAYSNYQPQSEWVANAQKFPLAWLNLLGLQDIPGTNLMELDSIKNLIRMIAAILLFVMPIVATICYPKYQGEDAPSMHRLIWVHWCVTALIMIGYICGALSAANWRISPILCTAIVVTMAFIRWAVAKKTSLGRISGVLLIPVLCFCALNTWQVLQLPYNSYLENEKYQLVDYLEQEDLDYGYATFWYANSMTVISDSQVEVRSVTVAENGVVTPYYYQTDRTWYEDQPNQDQYFLLLNSGEYNALVNNASSLLTDASETLEHTTSNNGVFYILVFDENIFDVEAPA